MATGTWKVYGRAPKNFNFANWLTNDIRIAILNSSYTPNQGTHDFWDDVSTFEISGTGYTAGGQALGTKAINESGSSQYFDAADANWPNSTITNGKTLVIYDNTPGTAATKPLIAYCVLDVAESSVNGNWPVAFNASGIFYIQAT